MGARALIRGARRRRYLAARLKVEGNGAKLYAGRSFSISLAIDFGSSFGP